MAPPGIIKRVATGLLYTSLAALAVALAMNTDSLREGLLYLRQAATWDAAVVTPIASDGPFAVCHELVAQDNTGRHATIVRELRAVGIEPLHIPIPGQPLPNVLVTMGDTGPYTLVVAHYDKSRETPEYQGASDNTAAICVLLATMRDLAVDDLERPVAFLFTGAEEQGLLGARAFVDWAGQSGLGVAEVINLDMIGRDRLAVRPEALPGFYFRLPVVGEVVFDGSRLRRGWPYEQPDAALVARLQRVAGDDLVVYRRVTAHSDGGVFQAAGLPVVSLSSDNAYYLNRVWERDADRVELLDEVHLEMVRRTVVDYVLREWDGE